MNEKDVLEKIAELVKELENALDPLEVFKITYQIKPSTAEIETSWNVGVRFLSESYGISEIELKEIFKKHLLKPLEAFGVEIEKLKSTRLKEREKNYDTANGNEFSKSC